MNYRAAYAAACCIFVSSCAPEVRERTFPLPVQRELTGTDGEPAFRSKTEVRSFVNMNDPNADAQIVRGIQDKPEGSGWRWTHERPEIRYRLDKVEGWSFAVDLGFPEHNMKQTGPVTVLFWINGNLLARVRYSKPGDYNFKKRVPAEWLKTGTADNLFAADVQPPWVSESDGAKLGFVLHRAGFVAK